MSRSVVRKGSRGDDVRVLQEKLNVAMRANLKVDGDFGEATEDAVEKFQEIKGLYADGIVGRDTWAALGEDKAPLTKPEPVAPARVPLSFKSVDLGTVPGDSYNNVRLRSDVVAAAQAVAQALQGVGAMPSSSGGSRSLMATVSPTRSATSLHYLGRAWDLWVGGAMGPTPTANPYLVTRDGDRLWRVWAQCGDAHGEMRTLTVVRSGRPEVTVSARVIDLTAIMEHHGFKRIPARPSAWKSIAVDGNVYGGTEWWHFQYEGGLVQGQTTFGEELLKVYAKSQVVTTPPWEYRDCVWANGGFMRK